MSNRSGEDDLSSSNGEETAFVYNHQKELNKIKSNECRRLVLFDENFNEDDVIRSSDACIDINEVTNREWQEGLYILPDDEIGPEITSLFIQGIRFGSNSRPKFETFGQILQDMDMLYTLTIKECPIGAEGLGLIARIFNKSRLRDLKLHDCNIETIEALSSHPLVNLSTLDLSKNPLGSEADCHTIGEILARRKTVLQDLNLSSCQIGDSGAEILSNLLKNKPYKNKLTQINLGGNPIGIRGCTAFSKLVFDDSSVQNIISSNHKLTIAGLDCEEKELANKIKLGTAINISCDRNPKRAAFVKELVVVERMHHENTKTNNSILLRRKDFEIANLIKKNILLEKGNRDLIRDVTKKESEIALLQSQLDELEKRKIVDLTADDASQGGNTHANPPPPKRSRGSDAQPSSLAILHEQTQAVVKVKVEATERAAAAERKAQTAQQEKEAAELKLECPACFEVDKDSCALVPCGHIFCSGCCGSYASSNCPTCRKEVDSCLRLFR